MPNHWILGVLAVASVAGGACTGDAPSVDRARSESEIVRLPDGAAAPAWAVPYGREWWRHAPGEIDVSDAIDRVQHAIVVDDARRGSVIARRFSADYDAGWLRFAGATGTLALRTDRVELGDATIYGGEARSWSARGNTVQALLAERDRLVEHHQIDQTGVAVTWVLGRRGRGDWRIELALRGSSEPGVRIGDAALVDARGRRWPVAAERSAGTIRWTVPALVLDDATFPVALDPLVSAEIDPDAPLSRDGVGNQDAPASATNGGSTLVVWIDTRDDQGDVYGARVGADGVVLDPYGIAIVAADNIQTMPAVATDGDDYFVIWTQVRAGMSELRGRRVTADGVALDGDGVTISSAPGYSTDSAVASNGDVYLVAWQVGNAIRARRVSSAGVVLDGSDRIVTATHGTTPAVASNGTDFLVAWADDRVASYQYDVYAGRVTAAGAIVDATGFVVSAAAQSQSDPTIASDGSDYVVAWADARNTSQTDIYGARVSSAGQTIDAAGFPISTASSYQRTPTIAWNGAAYVAIWIDQRTGANTVYGARVSPLGSVLDPTGIAIGGANNIGPVVSAGGGGALVVWQQQITGGDEIFARRLDANLAVLDSTPIEVSLAANVETRPAVASNGVDYLVVWQDHRDGLSSGDNANIYAVRLAADGTVLDPTAILVCGAQGAQWSPAVASIGADYLVVWQDGRSATNHQIYGTRVSAAGAVLDPVGIVIAPGAWQSVPAIASNGSTYLVAWSTQVNGQNDIYAARVSSGGVPSVAVPVAVGTDSQISAAVASRGGDWLVAWQSYNGHDFDVHASRVRADGAVIDESGLAIATTMHHEGNPAIGTLGDEYVITWSDGRNGTLEVFGTRVSTGGSVLDGTGLPLASGDASASAATAGNGDLLVAWSATGGIRATTFASIASPAPRFTIANMPGFATRPAVAATDAVYIVAYERARRVHVRFVGRACGDGIVQSVVEQCDGAGQTAACDADCTFAVCGDGVVNTAAGEGCDDANLDDTDGCLATCVAGTIGGDPDAGPGGSDGGSSASDANTGGPDAALATDAGVTSDAVDGTDASADAALGDPIDGGSGAIGDPAQGCGCRARGGAAGGGDLVLFVLALLAVSAGRARRASRRSACRSCRAGRGRRGRATGCRVAG